jgi:hypothetical protein
MQNKLKTECTEKRLIKDPTKCNVACSKYGLCPYIVNYFGTEG